MIAAALQLSLAFNLVCSGTMRSGPLGLALPEAGGAPFEITYRIDVDGRTWCSDRCDETEAVVRITGSEIVLRELNNPAGGSFVNVDLASGHFTDTLIVGNTATLRSGTCERAPFTGFIDDIA
jgi:hypothetical protein